MGASERRREMLPNDFRGSVHLPLSDVFHSLWDMGITFGMDRLVSADADASQSSGTSLVDPQASVRGSQQSGHGIGAGAGADSGARTDGTRTGARANAGPEAEVGTVAVGIGSLADTRPVSESVDQSSSPGDSNPPPPLRPASSSQLLLRFGLGDYGPLDVCAPGEASLAAGASSLAPPDAGQERITAAAGTWRSTCTAKQPVPEAAGVAGVGAGAVVRAGQEQGLVLPQEGSMASAGGFTPGAPPAARAWSASAVHPPATGTEAISTAVCNERALVPASSQAVAVTADSAVLGDLLCNLENLGDLRDLGIYEDAGAGDCSFTAGESRPGTGTGIESISSGQPKKRAPGPTRQRVAAMTTNSGLQGESSFRPVPGSPPPRASLSQRLAAALDAIQGPGQGGVGQKGEAGQGGSSIQSLRTAAALTASGHHRLPPAPSSEHLERKRRLALLSGPSRVTDVRKAMRTRQVPSHVPRGLVESLHHPPFIGGPAASNMRKRLMLAAEAVQAGNYALFEDMRCQLASFAKPRGVSMERIIHVMLRALEFRLKGGADAHINAVPVITSMQLVAKATVWFMTAHPASLFAAKSVTAMIAPVLARKPRPHLLISNPASVAELPVIMRILVEQWHMHRAGEGGPDAATAGMPFAQPGMPDAQPGGAQPGTSPPQPGSSCSSAPGPRAEHQPSSESSHIDQGSPASTPDAPEESGGGTPGPQVSSEASEGAPTERLHIRITYMDCWPLVRPGRTDISSEGRWDYIRLMLMQAAAAMGVDLDFSVLRLCHDNLDVIERFESEPGETFVACLLHEFKFLPSDPGKGGPLQRFVKKLVSLKPAMMVFQEENVECTEGDFVSRFGACMDFYWLSLDMNDACAGGKGRKWMSIVESGFQDASVYAICAREDERMSMQYHSCEEWDRLWRLWGFQGKAVREDILGPMRKMLANYPLGFEVQMERNWLFLAWCGIRIHGVSFWTPS